MRITSEKQIYSIVSGIRHNLTHEGIIPTMAGIALLKGNIHIYVEYPKKEYCYNFLRWQENLEETKDILPIVTNKDISIAHAVEIIFSKADYIKSQYMLRSKYGVISGTEQIIDKEILISIINSSDVSRIDKDSKKYFKKLSSQYKSRNAHIRGILKKFHSMKNITTEDIVSVVIKYMTEVEKRKNKRKELSI